MRVVVRNMTWLLLSQVATFSASMASLIIAPRRLGDANFGKLQFATVYIGFFLLAASLGSETYIVKVTARDESAVGLYIFNTLLMKLFLSAALSAAAIGLAFVIGLRGDLLTLVAVFCISLVAATLANTLVAGLQGMQRMGRIAAAAAAGVIVANALGLIVLFRHGSVVLYALAGTAAAWVPLIANFTKFWPYLRGNLHADLVICKRIVRGGLPFLMMSAVLTVYGLIDIPILEAVAGSKTVGWYALAYRWVGLPVVFASIVGTAVFPSLSARFEEQSDTFTDQANKAIRLVYFAGAPIATGLILVAPDMLRLLYPNTSFSSAVPVMQILAVHLPIVTITMMLAAVLVASDRQNSWVVVGCIAGAINITLNLIAIPLSIRVVHNGAIGASIVTVLTEAFVFAGALRLRPRGVFDTSTRNSLLRCTGACLAMAPPVLALHSAALPLKVGAGVVTFAAASFLLHVVTMDELRSMFSKGLRAPSPTT